MAVLALHAACLVALWQSRPLQRVVQRSGPVVFAWIISPDPPVPSATERHVASVPPTARRTASTATLQPARRDPVSIAPAPEAHPAAPASVSLATETPPPAAPPADVPPVAAPPVEPAPVTTPPAPRTIAISAVAYLLPPVLVYPPSARRRQEQGQVMVRVLVDEHGLPAQLAVLRTSGYPALDDAALATVRKTRFKPYTENGTAQPFWVVMPLIFELDG